MKRIDKENYYLDIAETVLERSTCLRRCYGAIIVKNDEIVSTGYNGAPRGRKNCMDLGYCTREAMNVPSGERYELCRSVHAEMNAIISAARRDTLGATLYLAGREAKSGELLHDATSCSMCRRLIINAGIDTVVTRNRQGVIRAVPVQQWVEEDDSIAAAPPAAQRQPGRGNAGGSLRQCLRKPSGPWQRRHAAGHPSRPADGPKLRWHCQ